MSLGQTDIFIFCLYFYFKYQNKAFLFKYGKINSLHSIQFIDLIK